MHTYSKQESLDKIIELIRFYEANKSETYGDETMIRAKFLDPFFSALNWDLSNLERRPLYKQFVYEEERIAIDGNKKRTDYTFCQGEGGVDNRAFFVEAKAPKVNIDRELDPAFQLRSYGWSAGLFISVLTNFEQFAIYNTYNIEPIKLDQAHKGRLEIIKYTDYAARFDDIWDLFEFNNVQDGSIREYVINKGIITDKVEKGRRLVGDAFLEQIEKWREILAKEIARQNVNSFISSDKEKINFAVQKIIDRIIFLRIIEDRGLEDEGNLKTIAPNYKALCKYFEYADEKYNSGLFNFSKDIERGIPDNITRKLSIVDMSIQKIINSLYEKAYKFDVIPAYILGSVYERFLGNEIILAGSETKSVQKPDVRKAGGVYYTPEHIVRYIVDNTITPKQDCKILDISCGSGAFLIVAYQKMLDYYNKKQPHKKLTLQQRKQILLDHIYGVDIDDAAVEVTKLSLLLKVLEGISRDEIESSKRRNEHALPSLHNNIKCGNSLVDDKNITAKAFVWEKEFPQVFGLVSRHSELVSRHSELVSESNKKTLKQVQGDESESNKKILKQVQYDENNEQVRNDEKKGFDFIIGNPPYVQLQKDKENSKNYFHYETYTATGDIYCLFYERAMKLLKPNGTLGYITSNKWMRASYGEKLRGFFSNYNPVRLIDFSGIKIFDDATVDCNILIIEKKENKNNTIACQIKKEKVLKFRSRVTFQQNDTAEGKNAIDIEKYVKKNYNVCTFNTNNTWVIMNDMEANIKSKIEKNGTPLKQWDINIYRGIVTGYNEAFIIDAEKRTELIMKDPKSNEIIKPMLRGRDIKRYSYKFKDKYIIISRKGIELKEYPAVYKHLLKYKDKLEKKVGTNEWYILQASPSDNLIDQYSKNKIIWSDMCTEPKFIYTEKEIYFNNTVYCITNAPRYLLGILNSKITDWYFPKIASGLGAKGVRYFKQFVEKLPIPIPSKRTENKIEKLLDQILKAKAENKRTEILELQIDEIIYELYGLTDEEIKFISE